MLLNCDLGESFGNFTMGMDAEVMPHIHQANIACGFHGGDPVTIRRTLSLAHEHQVVIGAHPAYPDLAGFGRRSMHLSAEELEADLLYQVAALDGMARSQGLELAYVKPHGALYNDMMANTRIRHTVMHALANYHRPLPLMLLATPEAEQYRQEAARAGLPGILLEAFADRCYTDEGHLLSRRENGAVHDRDRTLGQVRELCQTGTVTTASGRALPLQADTICVHGDNVDGISVVREIRTIVDAS